MRGGRRWAAGAAVVVLGIIAVVAVLALVLKWAPNWLAQPGLKGKDRAEDIGRARTALLATLAGVIAVTGAVFTGLSYRLNRESHALDREGQITERFTRAIDQLGSLSLDVRLGGIYALERIAKDSPDDHPQVIEVLTAFIREHAPWPPTSPTTDNQGALVEPGDSDSDRPPKLPTEIQAAMTVLGRRKHAYDRASLNLGATDLRRLELTGGDMHLEAAHFENSHLEAAVLSGVHLERASIVGAHLEGAQLSEAHLEGAQLSEAHLEGAELTAAHLEGAQLSEAHLEGAELTGAHLDHARLFKAHLERAWMLAAHLEDARLSEAHLQGAELTEADLRDADLNGAHLEGAQLGYADLGGANLTGAQLDGAFLEGARYSDGDVATKWPEGFDPDATGAIKVSYRGP